MGGDVRPLGRVAAGAADVARIRATASWSTTPTSSAGATSTTTARRIDSRRTTSTRRARSCGSWPSASGRRTSRTRPRGASDPTRSPADRPNGGRIAVSYAWNDITLPLRPQDEHLQAIGQRGEEADRSRRRQAGRAQERRRDAHVLRAAERRQQQAPARGGRDRLRDGLDRHERPHDQGHVAQGPV